MNEPREDIEYDADLPQELDWDNWVFDTAFFKECEGGSLDGGGMVAFQLNHKTNDSKMYLHLFNSHNGYYGHGFEFKIGDDVKHEDTL